MPYHPLCQGDESKLGQERCQASEPEPPSEQRGWKYTDLVERVGNVKQAPSAAHQRAADKNHAVMLVCRKDGHASGKRK